MAGKYARQRRKKIENSFAAAGGRGAEAKLFIRALGGDKSRGIMQIGHLRLPCALGRTGISAFKREGDGATPRARLAICGGFRQSRLPLPHAGLKLRRTAKEDGWCDAPRDRNYNRRVRLPYSASAENLYRQDELYAVGFILDWNITPRLRGRGSAIFLHIARPSGESAAEGASKFAVRQSAATALFRPTAGCIAVSARNMRLIMPHLKYGTKIRVLG